MLGWNANADQPGRHLDHQDDSPHTKVTAAQWATWPAELKHGSWPPGRQPGQPTPRYCHPTNPIQMTLRPHREHVFALHIPGPRGKGIFRGKGRGGRL